MRNVSEDLFARFCRDNGIRCEPVPRMQVPTPDALVYLGTTRVACEIKQIDPSDADKRELDSLRAGDGQATTRVLPNRLRRVLKDISRQLRNASQKGLPTMLVVYDNTPFQEYVDHFDVVQALFGEHSTPVHMTASGATAGEPFFGSNRGVALGQNTSLSALAILDGSPTSKLSMRVYHNPHAAVRLDPALLDGIACTQPFLPGDTEVRV